jgi:hypothetical protein
MGLFGSSSPRRPVAVLTPVETSWDDARSEAERRARAEVARLEQLTVHLRAHPAGGAAAMGTVAGRLGVARLELRHTLTHRDWVAHLRDTRPERLAELCRVLGRP